MARHPDMDSYIAKRIIEDVPIVQIETDTVKYFYVCRATFYNHLKQVRKLSGRHGRG